MGGRCNFRSERGRGERTSVMFTQARVRGDQGDHSGSNLPHVNTVPGRDVQLYRYT